MKPPVLIALGVSLAFTITMTVVSRRQNDAARAELAARTTAWQQEKATLETALKRAKNRPAVVETPAPEPVVVIQPAIVDPRQIIARLKGIQIGAGAEGMRNARLAIHSFEQLIQTGSASLPAIREFLMQNQELDYDLTGLMPGKSSRNGQLNTEFLVPPSLRLGLLDAARRIGGKESATLLGETLGTTVRGFEVAYLARVLQEMAPGKWRATALTTARELLNHPVNTSVTGPLDRNDREYLYGVLTFFNDPSYAAQAQAQLITGEGSSERGAITYLQQTLGAQAIPIAAQAYQDPRLTDAAAKEPLARLALAFAGADAQANAFYQQTINDPALPKNTRRNLIEDLNEDGLNYKNLTPADLPLIQSRLQLIETLAPNAMDQANAAAFKEAYKDLLKMREKVQAPAK